LAVAALACSLVTLKGVTSYAAIGTIAGSTVAAFHFWFSASRSSYVSDHTMWHMSIFYGQLALCLAAPLCDEESFRCGVLATAAEAVVESVSETVAETAAGEM